MDSGQWDCFFRFREDFKSRCEKWAMDYGDILRPVQEKLASENKPPYPLENSIVYNTDLDKISEGDEIKLILIGDNPGKNEQLEKNKKYLCGLAGKIGENFFKNNSELNIDFRKNVIILNKTPVHTAKTNQLKDLISESPRIAALIDETQIYMAKTTAELQKKLDLKLWIIGYGELKKNGIFQKYTDTLRSILTENNALEKLFVYQHFSMNRFSIDLRDFSEQPEAAGLSLEKRLEMLGALHRNEKF